MFSCLASTRQEKQLETLFHEVPPIHVVMHSGSIQSELCQIFGFHDVFKCKLVKYSFWVRKLNKYICLKDMSSYKYYIYIYMREAYDSFNYPAKTSMETVRKSSSTSDLRFNLIYCFSIRKKIQKMFSQDSSE